MVLHGAVVTTYSEGEVGFIKKGKLFIDNGLGNDPCGPFDAKTGKYLGDTVFGFTSNVLTKKPADIDKP